MKPSIGALNVLKVLEIEDRLDIPVFQGADRSLKNRFLSSNVKRRRDVSHGKRGLGNLHIDIKRMNNLWFRLRPMNLREHIPFQILLNSFYEDIQKKMFQS